METKLLLSLVSLLVYPNVCLLLVMPHLEYDSEFLISALNTDENLHFTIVELPSNFNSYDINKDGAITLDELANTTETTMNDANQPFKSADKDGNCVLSEEEFKDAPWVFTIPQEMLKSGILNKEANVIT